MTIEFDQPRGSPLPPLHPKPAPSIPIDTLLAINTVTLTAAGIPPRVLGDFYSNLLGLTPLPSNSSSIIRFAHNTRIIQLDPAHPPGQLALLIRNFSDALLRLRDRRISHELLHPDAGLSRAAILRDPAGNWIHLLETRAF